MISVVAELDEKKGFDEVIFENYANAVCNNRGGVIIIGAEKKDGHYIALGIRFKNMEEVVKREDEIKLALLRIKPICYYLIQKVLVHTNYIRPTKINEENMCFCFRILLFPYRANRVSYN